MSVPSKKEYVARRIAELEAQYQREREANREFVHTCAQIRLGYVPPALQEEARRFFRELGMK